MTGLRLGLADHLGWAVAVTAGADHQVVDRRRIALIGPDLSEAPIHYDRGRSDDATMAALIAEARGWAVHLYDAKTVEARAVKLLGSGDALIAPRAQLGPPWTKDHRQALAATVLAALG